MNNRHKYQSGLSLIEIVAALVIGGIASAMVAAIMAFFLDHYTDEEDVKDFARKAGNCGEVIIAAWDEKLNNNQGNKSLFSTISTSDFASITLGDRESYWTETLELPDDLYDAAVEACQSLSLEGEIREISTAGSGGDQIDVEVLRIRQDGLEIKPLEIALPVSN